MPEPLDVYADQMGLNIGAFGCALNFALSSAVPPSPGGAVQGQTVATVRMSLEHLKLMTFLLKRQVAQFEHEAGVRIPVAPSILNQLRIGREDWDAFWGGNGR